MKIDLPTPLVLALRDEYPGCLPDADSMSAMIEEITWAWLSRNRTARRMIAEHRPVDGIYDHSALA